jgi:cytokinin dehydrogenase
LLRNDLTDLSGTLLFDDAARQTAADDFGHILHRLPLAVLKPGSVQDIVKLVQFANRRDLKVAIRGNGHAMFGQTQVEGGVVIDSNTLNSVRGNLEGQVFTFAVFTDGLSGVTHLHL